MLLVLLIVWLLRLPIQSQTLHIVYRILNLANLSAALIWYKDACVIFRWKEIN
jgi:hypothetical protein